MRVPDGMEGLVRSSEPGGREPGPDDEVDVEITAINVHRRRVTRELRPDVAAG
ncbi:hypothetical protein [Streptomyces sp. NPDC002133]|uniref:hypothetical protein n=1 Tax=Streptomyces sp. NPDC002133 TaxID=3154409 RepID=UPI003320378B